MTTVSSRRMVRLNYRKQNILFGYLRQILFIWTNIYTSTDASFSWSVVYVHLHWAYQPNLVGFIENANLAARPMRLLLLQCLERPSYCSFTLVMFEGSFWLNKEWEPNQVLWQKHSNSTVFNHINKMHWDSWLYQTIQWINTYSRASKCACICWCIFIEFCLNLSKPCIIVYQHIW